MTIAEKSILMTITKDDLKEQELFGSFKWVEKPHPEFPLIGDVKSLVVKVKENIELVQEDLPNI